MRAELDERGRRCWAASEALELGHGGIKAVASATGLCERTVLRGCKQLRQEWPPKDSDKRRIRQSGGGLLALALPLTVVAFPGDKGDFEGHHANRLEHLSKRLDLTPEQKTKVEALFKVRDEIKKHP